MCVFSSSIKLDIENEVNNEMANRMSLFYAEATPMLKTLSTATTNFVTEVLPAVLHSLAFSTVTILVISFPSQVL